MSQQHFIKREKGKYYLTTFGKIVYDLTFEYMRKLDSVIEDCWKFKALDLLDISDEFTNDEKRKMMEHMFNHINQNMMVQEKKKQKENDIGSSNEKVRLPYIQYLQNENIS